VHRLAGYTTNTMRTRHPILSWLLCSILAFVTPTFDGCKKSGEKQPSTPNSNEAASVAPASAAPAATYARPSPDELYQLVAPIALFPDNLIAQVLAGSTYPDQIESAETWLKQNPALKGADLMQAINEQPWDVSVKGLTQFPDVLGQMGSNLSWTSALGDAYFNTPQDVMNSIQVMRQRSSQAGNLKSTPQQTVTTETAAPPPQPQSSPDQPLTVVQAPPQTIVIQPAQPDVVYVPSYNPTVVYGAPVAVYPGYVAPPPPSSGELVATGLISFGLGMAVGAAMNNNCCGWGWNSWGAGWHNSTVVYNRNTYVSTSNTFVNRNNYYNRNVNNVNFNNASFNNANRNNFNANNVNRNNINRENVNNYRANNFNQTARDSNFTTPNFGTQRNQTQFRKVNESSLGQASSPQNRQQRLQAENRQQPVQASNRQQLGQPQDRQPRGEMQNRQPTPQSQNRSNVNDAQRGYGQPERGTSSGAFSNYGQGGNERVNSARGQQSLSGNSSRNTSRKTPSSSPTANRASSAGGRRR